MWSRCLAIVLPLVIALASTFPTWGLAEVMSADGSVAASPCDSPDVVLESYHVHVLFWPSNKESTRAAMDLQYKFIDAFGTLAFQLLLVVRKTNSSKKCRPPRKEKLHSSSW